MPLRVAVRALDEELRVIGHPWMVRGYMVGNKIKD